VEEPIEEVVIDVDEEHSGVVVQKMTNARRDDQIAPRRHRLGWCSTRRPAA